MEGLSSAPFETLVNYLNSGCDQGTAIFINEVSKKLPTISAVFPVLNRDSPWQCLRNLLLLFVYSGSLLFSCYMLFISSIELFKINFVLLVHEIHLMFLVQMSMVMLWDAWSKRSNTATLYKIIANNFFDYQEDLSQTLKVLRLEMKKAKKSYVLCVILIGFATSVAVIAVPLLNKFGTFPYDTVAYPVNFDLAIPLAYPFTATDPVSFTAEYAYVLMVAFLVAMINCTKSFMTIDCNLHVQMQVKLLLLQIENVEERAVRLYVKLYGQRPELGYLRLHNNSFSKCYSICLRKTIQHHQIILKATNEVNNVFGFYVFIYYLTATVDIAMSMLSTSSADLFPGTTVGAITMCLVEIGFVALFAHLGQKLTDLTTELREVIYNMPWVCCDASVKRTISILQLATLKPINFSFHSLLQINYDSFATVMHSAYSYYNLVNAYDKE